MANNIAGRPWIIDTASASPIKMATATPGRVRCHGFTYRDYAAAGNTAVIKDTTRNVVVCKLIGQTDLSPVGELWEYPQDIQGLAVTQIDGSGIVEVFLR